MPTSGFQDYSALVDPRTLPSSSSFDIDSILEDDTLDLSVETSLPEDTRSRSLKSSIEALAAGEDEKKTALAGEGNDGIDFDSDFVAAEKDKEVTKRRRRKRDVPITEESASTSNAQDQFPDVEGVSDSFFSFFFVALIFDSIVVA